ncbi:MAG TPA: hypothetical protein VFZ34_32735 [Blastocatellia bacterium]|nr:hypothetical protein [Blastocatellia bacterium]
MSKITRVELHAFTFETENLGLGQHAAAGVGNLIYLPGSKLTTQRIAVRIQCDDGAQGEYVTHWVGTLATLGQMQMLAPNLLGRDAEQRALIYDDLKREVRAYDHMAHGPLDIALWDLAGKKYGVSVARMLGAFTNDCRHMQARITRNGNPVDSIRLNRFANTRRRAKSKVSSASKFTVGTTAMRAKKRAIS